MCLGLLLGEVGMHISLHPPSKSPIHQHLEPPHLPKNDHCQGIMYQMWEVKYIKHHADVAVNHARCWYRTTCVSARDVNMQNDDAVSMC
jgi:hypothetical protein